ncbi:MAG: CRTAC1 family protein [Acidobacteria bacterium]|nr:CRTAC1 family protein [Acidobacteriota bacterium]
MRRNLSLALVAAAVLVANGGAGRWFADVTGQAGIRHKHTNRAFENPYAHIMAGYTALGASGAVADFDGDGWEDIFATDSQKSGKNRLYRNNGNLTFTDVAREAGVAEGNDDRNASSDALWFDYNGDGRPDLFVIRFGQSLLYENLGNGKFRDVTRQAGLTRYANSITAIAFDYDLDSDLDLFVGDYFQPVDIFKPNTPRFFPENFETANNGGGVAVFRNDKGAFTNVSAQVGIKISGWTLDLGHADADLDGDDDLYVAADFGTDRFFVNNGNGTFTDLTDKAIGVDSKKGMNVDWGDFDNDGYFDVYVTNITDDYMREGNFLWKNNGNLTFTDVSREMNVHDTGWGWAAKFFDYDNDGWQDIYAVNGWVSAGKDSYVPDIFEMVVKANQDFADARNWPPMGNKSLSGYQKNRLFRNHGGQAFKDEATLHGVDSVRDGRGVALADFDRDGRVDMFVSNANAEPFLYRNTAPARSWIGFEFEGRKSNRSAIGAVVTVTAGGRTQKLFVNGGNGFASQSSREVRFGLADAGQAAVKVRWPSGETQVFENLAANKTYKIAEGGKPAAWMAKR